MSMNENKIYKMHCPTCSTSAADERGSTFTFDRAVSKRALRAVVASNGVGDAILALRATRTAPDNIAAFLLELLEIERERGLVNAEPEREAA